VYSGNTYVGLDQRSYCTLGPVSAFGRTNHLGAETMHPGLLSLSPPSVVKLE